MNYSSSSIARIVGSAQRAFLRFPLAIISSILCACVSIYLVENGEEIDNIISYVNILLVAALGIPTYFSITAYSIKNPIKRNYKLLLFLAATTFLALIYLLLPSADATHNVVLSYTRYAVFNVLVHLLVLFLPYVSDSDTGRFWYYNRFLFSQFATSILYAVLLIIGLTLPILGIKILFNLDISDSLFTNIRIGVITVFTTWFFLANMPERFHEIDSQQKPPSLLKSILQFVAVPLLMVYLLILYTYSVKIIALWDWPKGIVSYMIAVVAVLGTLTYALLYPYKDAEKNLLTRLYIKYYFPLLIPLIALLFIAVSIRIDEYGVTVNRYLIVLLGVWMSIVSIYFIWKKSHIKFIPISLSVLFLLASFGPWGAFPISEQSQINRLHQLLTDNQLLVNERIQNEVVWQRDKLPEFESAQEKTNDRFLDDTAHQQIRSIIFYLDSYHGFANIKEWVQQPLDSLLAISFKENRYKNEADIYFRTLGLGYRNYKTTATTYTFSSANMDNQVVHTAGFDYLMDFYLSVHKESSIKATGTASFHIEKTPFSIQYKNKKGRELLVILNQKDTSTISLSPLMHNKPAGDSYSTEFQSNRYTIKVEIMLAEIEKNNDIDKVRYMRGRLFVRKDS